jgi:hypothetical protein
MRRISADAGTADIEEGWKLTARLAEIIARNHQG